MKACWLPSGSCVDPPCFDMRFALVCAAFLLAPAGACAAQSVLIDSQLLQAATGWNTALVSSLLDRGAHIESADRRGQTSLMLAARQGRTEIVRLLLDRGSNTGAKDRSGVTALHDAVGSFWASTQTVKLLLDHSAKVDAKDKSGMTPLAIIAASYVSGGVPMASLLLARGAKLDARDAEGMTPLMNVAARGYNTALAALFLNKGAKLEARDRSGRTALIQPPPVTRRGSCCPPTRDIRRWSRS